VEEKALILVIDDEESMRDSCQQTLVKDGYKVETASDGKTALEKIKETKPIRSRRNFKNKLTTKKRRMKSIKT
jgi:DNA-binding NtrC family response regulator